MCVTVPPAEKLKKPKVKEATEFQVEKERDKIFVPSLKTPTKRPSPTPPAPPPTAPAPEAILYPCEKCPEVSSTPEEAREHARTHGW